MLPPTVPTPCAEDPDTWFPAGWGPLYQDQISNAQYGCGRCPIIDECLEAALTDGDEHGIRGGLTPNRRSRIRGAGTVHRKPGACGTVAGYGRHRRKHEPCCPACVRAMRLYQRKWRAKGGAAA